MDYEAIMYGVLEGLVHDESAEPRELPISLLRAITNDFANDREIGSDDYFVLYKGVLRNAKVAVKKLKQQPIEIEERFVNEVACLMRMRAKHKNIVRFLGYCADTQGKAIEVHENFVVADVRQRLLCFEYPSGGKLDKYITGTSHGLGWRKRYKIIKGICEGLYYLHQNHTVHLDLKPQNIWLDEKKVPKIHLSCVSRRLEEKQIKVRREDINGSPGYWAPEYSNGVITLKADIYSLGAVIGQILIEQLQDFAVKNVLKSWADRLGTSLEDTRLEQIRVCAEIVNSCLEMNLEERPGVEHIIQMLVETESTDDFVEEPDEMDSVDGFTSDEQDMELNILERVLVGSEEPRHLDFSLLQSITENFSEQRKVGIGGCADVYKGILRNGIIAVKRLFNSRTIENKMFHREVQSLITVRHENIVRFLGYCSITEERTCTIGGKMIMAEIRERLLCFEYIRNGNLENHLTDELRGLEWHTRYEIIVGICKGLLYLHKDKDIVHMDLKPANILLDDRMVPKITDFGLSRFDNNSYTKTSSRLISLGYCAPEYFKEGKSSSKSDIYSLGVMIIELVTGTKNEPNLSKVLRRWRHRWIKSSKHTPLSYQQVTKCLELAQRCTQIDPTSRPDIVDITHELSAVDGKGGQFQKIPCLDDMLGIEPLEIHLPFDPDPLGIYFLFEHDLQLSPSVELNNDTDDCIAFMTKARSRRFHTEPDKGIVPPRSKCSVTVTMQPQVNALLNNHYKEEITVLSTRVDGGLGAMDITRDVFIEKEGTMVDEVTVMVVFDQPQSCDEES